MKELEELKKETEIKNRKLLNAMYIIVSISVIFYLTIIVISIYCIEKGTLQNVIIFGTTIFFIITVLIGLKFEVDAGYYECKNCHHRYIPKYKEALFSIHTGTTRYMKCPKCNTKNWAKKVLTK